MAAAWCETGRIERDGEAGVAPFPRPPRRQRVVECRSREQREAGSGLWAMEPHIGRDGVGAKWEEMLVVTDNDAYWLDDAVSHLRV